MVAKANRQTLILELISTHDVASQEELRGLLKSRGIGATQATLSRDLRELGLVRVPGRDGARYALPERVASEGAPSLDVLLPQLFSSIDGVGELSDVSGCVRVQVARLIRGHAFLKIQMRRAWRRLLGDDVDNTGHSAIVVAH